MGVHLTWGLKAETEKSINRNMPSGYNHTLKWNTNENAIVIKAYKDRIYVKFIIDFKGHSKSGGHTFLGQTIDSLTITGASYTAKLRTAKGGYSKISDGKEKTLSKTVNSFIDSLKDVKLDKLPTTNIDMLEFKDNVDLHSRPGARVTGVGGIIGATILGFARPVGKVDLELLDHFNPESLDDDALFLIRVTTIKSSTRFVITDGERWHGVTNRGTYKLTKAKAMLEEVSYMNQIDRHMINEAIRAFFG